jgi:prepilin-type N-terminal cleavage/methylation domain-containing protein
MDAPRRARGFTLVEMVIAMAVVAILAGMSAVALNRMKTRGSFASATGDFLATLRTARAEAATPPWWWSTPRRAPGGRSRT